MEPVGFSASAFGAAKQYTNSQSGGGGSKKPAEVGKINENSVFPIKRSNGPLEIGDWVTIDPHATLPFEINGVRFEKLTDTAVFLGNGVWKSNVASFQHTDTLPVKAPVEESLKGDKLLQSDINKEVAEAIKLLQGEYKRLYYTTKTNPTAAEILAFVKSKGYQDSELVNVAVVVKDTHHVWKYYVDDGYVDQGIDTILFDPNGGIDNGSNGVKVKTGNGLEIDNNEVVVKAKNTGAIKVDSNGVAVEVDDEFIKIEENKLTADVFTNNTDSSKKGLVAAKIKELIEGHVPDTTKELTEVDWNKSNVKFDGNFSNCCKKGGKYWCLSVKTNYEESDCTGWKKILELPFAISGNTVILARTTKKKTIPNTTEMYVDTELSHVLINGKDVTAKVDIGLNERVSAIEITALIDRENTEDAGIDYSQEFESLNGSLDIQHLIYRKYNGMTIFSFCAKTNNTTTIKLPQLPKHNLAIPCVIGSGTNNYQLSFGIANINIESGAIEYDSKYGLVAMQCVWFDEVSEDVADFGEAIKTANPDIDFVYCNARYINGFALQELAVTHTVEPVEVSEDIEAEQNLIVFVKNKNLIKSTISGTIGEDTFEDDGNGNLVLNEETIGAIDYERGKIMFSAVTGPFSITYQYMPMTTQTEIDETITINHAQYINGIENGPETQSPAWNKIKSTDNKLVVDNKTGVIELNGVLVSNSDIPTIIVPNIPSSVGTFQLKVINGILQWIEE